MAASVKYPGGFLEGSRRQEGIGGQGSFGNPQQNRLGRGRLAALGKYLGIFLFKFKDINQPAG
jgi:hypothetical protein